MKLNVSRIFGLVFFAGAVLVSLSGCGGSGSDGPPPPPPDANPTGYYTNTGMATVKADIGTSLDITDLQGMVTSTQLTLLSVNAALAYVGTITVNQSNFSGTVTVYENGVATQSGVPVSGTITQGSRIDGTLGGTGTGNGTFTLLYALPADNGPVDNSMVVNDLDWRPFNNTENFTVDLSLATTASAIDNIYSGSPGSGNFSGCDFVGRVDPLAGTHLYTVTGSMRNCSTPAVDSVPAYAGLASVRGTNPNDRFIMILTNGEYGINGEFTR